MTRLLSFLTFTTVLVTPFATAAESVLINSPIVIEGTRAETTAIATTEVNFVRSPAEAGTAGLSERAANFFVASNGAHSFNDTFALRGLTNTPIFGDPAVTFYLDEIPLGGGFTTPDVFGGATAAKLYRGPGQNTGFGQAGSAGVVGLLTPEPGSAATGQIELSAGNFSSRNASALISTANGGKADALISAQYATRDGYIYNQVLGEDVDHQQSSTGLARINLYPIAALKLTVIAQATRARDGEQPLVPLNGPMYTINRKGQGETNLDAFNIGITAAALLPWGRLSFTSSINDWQLGPYRSFLAFGPAELLNNVKLSQRNYNQELKLISLEIGDLRWHAGLYFSGGTTDGAFSRAFGPYVMEDSSYTIDTQRLAAYGEASFHIKSDLTLTAGLRIEGAKKSFDRKEKIPSPQRYTLSHESSALLPKLEIEYQPGQKLHLFGSVGGGYKPGGFSAFTSNRALAAFGPERTVAIEGGVSQAVLNNTLAWTARGFNYEIRGYQIEHSFDTGSMTDDYLVVNAPGARSSGLELELAWKPVQGLSVTFDYGFSHVTLLEFTDPFTGRHYDGNRAPYVPQYDYALRCEYQHASGWFIMLKVSANGRTDYTEAEDDAFAQNSYGLLGGRLGFATSRWQVALYAENILSEQYYSSISAGTKHGNPGAPRTQGLEARLTF